MIRVLQIVDSMDMGGIQAFIMNVYREINKQEIQFDFLVMRQHHQIFEDEIVSSGGKIFKIASRRDSILKNVIQIKNFFTTHPEYKIIHYHTSALHYITPLTIAKCTNVPIRIVHSHSTKILGAKINRLLHRINKSRIHLLATDYFSCGESAADWMFGETKIRNKVRIVNNGIEIKKYQFNDILRNKIRKQLGVADKTVIGHIGRFHPVKNHEFLIKVFNNLCKMDDKYVLILIGDGEQKDTIQRMIVDFGIQNKVLMLGRKMDAYDYYHAFDIFVMPSFYEGFPVTAVEAQASGINLVLSDTITSDVIIKNTVYSLSLDLGPSKWARFIDNIEIRREINNSKLIEAGYDINNTVTFLTNFYNKRINLNGSNIFLSDY